MFRNSKAFTLIELMVVIVIIGILATLAIPKFNEASLKAKVSEAPTVLSSYDNAQLAYLAEASAMGAVSSMVMENVGATKYYTYSESWTDYDEDGGYNGVAKTTGMGDVGGNNVWTEISTEQTLTHDKETDYDKFLPNWKP